MKQLTDSQLLTKFINGKEGAFIEIYERYWAKLFVHSIRVLKDPDIAKDIVKEVFYSILSNPSISNSFPSLADSLYSFTRKCIILKLLEGEKGNGFLLYIQTTKTEPLPSREEIDHELKKMIESDFESAVQRSDYLRGKYSR